jgi:hypothetical protein
MKFLPKIRDDRIQVNSGQAFPLPPNLLRELYLKVVSDGGLKRCGVSA